MFEVILDVPEVLLHVLQVIVMMEEETMLVGIFTKFKLNHSQIVYLKLFPPYGSAMLTYMYVLNTSYLGYTRKSW